MALTPSPGFDPEAFSRDSERIWDEASCHYDEISRECFGPATAEFVAFSGIKPGDRVLDLACGTGGVSFPAARRCGPSGHVAAVDFSSEMLRIASRRPPEPGAGAAPIEWRRMNAEALDFPDASFDAVICQLGLMLFARPARALAEMSRVVKPGGSVACLVQGEPGKMIFTSLLNKAMVRHVPELKVPGAPTIYDFGPPGVLEKALAAAGLGRIEERRPSGTFHFNSVDEYWGRMAAGAGRTGVLLKSLDAARREALRAEVFAKAQAYIGRTGFDIPYEFVMARGVKPVPPGR